MHKDIYKNIYRLSDLIKSKIDFNKLYLVCLAVLFLVVSFFRLYKLDYSDFYGDETKLFYLRKDIGIFDFLLSQRKGPVQYLIVWFIQEAFGLTEFTARFPFALFSIATVCVLYMVFREITGKWSALIGVALFALNGFSIAFGRTAQYQSILFFFGFSCLYVSILYMKKVLNARPLNKHFHHFLIGLFGALSLLTHWDGIYFVFASLMFVVIANMSEVSREVVRKVVFSILSISVPFIILFLPYVVAFYMAGSFTNDLKGYLERRITGQDALPSDSFYTYWVYNPSTFYIMPFAIIALFSSYLPGLLNVRNKFERVYLLVFTLWFLFAFTVNEVVFKSAGTHIFNYVIPAILFVVVLVRLFAAKTQKLIYAALTLCLIFMFNYSMAIYIPGINNGYPWKASTQKALFTISLPKAKKEDYQLFLYGFPYNRNWREVRIYFKDRMPRNFATNDNVTIAEYYLYPVSSTRYFSERGPKELPDVYIDVKNNSENKISPVVHPGEITELTDSVKIIDF